MVIFVEAIATFPTMAIRERLGFGTWLLVVQLEVHCKVGPGPSIETLAAIYTPVNLTIITFVFQRFSCNV